MFNWLSGLLDKLWNWIRKIIAIVLVVVAAVLLVYALFTGLWLYAWYALAALVGAFLIDEDTAAAVVGRVGEVISNVVEAVAEVAGSVVSSVIGSFIGSLLSSPIGIAAVGFGLWYLLGRSQERDLISTDPFVSDGDDDDNSIDPSEEEVLV